MVFWQIFQITKRIKVSVYSSVFEAGASYCQKAAKTTFSFAQWLETSVSTHERSYDIKY